MSDTRENVNKPKHYNSHPSGIECIQVAEHYGFNIGNAIKYLWRCGLKDAETQELGKAVWYILREILLRGGDITELLAYWQREEYARVPGHAKPSTRPFTPEDLERARAPVVTAPLMYELSVRSDEVPTETMGVLRDVLRERQKQVAKGFDEAHDDDEHTEGEIAGAAACYITGRDLTTDTDSDYRVFPDGWPDFERETDRERQLIIGITLATAELERIRRKKK